MNKRVLIGAACGAVLGAILPAFATDKGVVGRWDVSVGDEGEPACLNAETNEAAGPALFLWGGGSPNRADDLKIEGNTISFKAYGRTWTGKVEGDTIAGTAVGKSDTIKWTGKRFIPRVDVTGTWIATFERNGRKGQPVTFQLFQKGDEVTGEMQTTPVQQIHDGKVDGDLLSFMVKQGTYKAKVMGDVFRGQLTGGSGGSTKPPTNFSGRREHRWAEPIELFNGKNLEGWKPLGAGRNFHWKAAGGIMSTERGDNIVSEKKFRDFKLHVEFRVPKDGNSGVYLRGRYEIQVEDDFGKPVGGGTCGAVYGRIVPKENACKPAGEWQTFDIKLVGMYVTVVQNGKTIIDNQEIPGTTGEALDADENAPGPIYIQGNHSAIEYRKVTITPAKE